MSDTATTPYRRMSEPHVDAFSDTTDKSAQAVNTPTPAKLPPEQDEGKKHSEEDKETLQLLVPRGELGGASPSLWSTTTRESRLILLSLFLVQVTDVMCISIMAPFFPKEAEMKGLGVQTVGWIFAIFPLVRFICSPLFGKLIAYTGCRSMVVMGQVCTSLSFIAFGLLDYLASSPGDSLTFTVLCFLFRALTAAGSAASGTAAFTVVSVEFQDRCSQCYGILQSAIGLGLIIGPAIGGLLYAGGGYVVPFAVLGCCILLTVPLSRFSLPRHETVEAGDHVTWSAAAGLLLNATVALMGVSILVASLIWSSLEPTLEPHLRQFDLSPALLGLVYFMIGAIYALCCPLVGWISDKKPSSSLLLMTAGFVLAALCMLLLGPSPLLGDITRANTFWLSLVSLGSIGAAASFVVVPCYNKILEASGGTKDQISFALGSFIAGYYNGCWSLGEFLGPLIGAGLAEAMGFGWANSIEAILAVVTAAGITVLHLFHTMSPSAASTTSPKDPATTPTAQTAQPVVK